MREGGRGRERRERGRGREEKAKCTHTHTHTHAQGKQGEPSPFLHVSFIHGVPTGARRCEKELAPKRKHNQSTLPFFFGKTLQSARPGHFSVVPVQRPNNVHQRTNKAASRVAVAGGATITGEQEFPTPRTRMMRLVLLASAFTGSAAAGCGRTQAQNFLLGPSGLTDNSLCAFPPVYYCNDPLATNYQSGEGAAARARPGWRARAECMALVGSAVRRGSPPCRRNASLSPGRYPPPQDRRSPMLTSSPGRGCAPTTW